MYTKILVGTTLVVCALHYVTFEYLSINANKLNSKEIRDYQEHQYYRNLSTLWNSVEDEC